MIITFGGLRFLSELGSSYRSFLEKFASLNTKVKSAKLNSLKGPFQIQSFLSFFEGEKTTLFTFALLTTYLIADLARQLHHLTFNVDFFVCLFYTLRKSPQCFPNSEVAVEKGHLCKMSGIFLSSACPPLFLAFTFFSDSFSLLSSNYDEKAEGEMKWRQAYHFLVSYKIPNFILAQLNQRQWKMTTN